jgi:zinc protease
MRSLFLFSVTMSLLVTSAFSESKPSTKSQSIPGVPSTTAQAFTLPNGLTVIVDEDHTSPVASVQAWCHTGSIDEGKWMGAGLSHILEHMLFKGTEKRKTSGQIAREVQAGGGYINAYTSFDRTVYHIDTTAAAASEAVDILADAMMNSTLPPDEYTKEQEVIRREYAMGFDDPDRQSALLMFRTVFSQSPFRHPTIGYLDIYNALTRENVFEYYKRRYVPNNLFFVVTGDVDTAKIKAQLETYFEKYPRKALEPVYVASEPEQAGRRDAHEEFPTELTRMSLAWPIPPITDPDMPALDVLGTVLGGGASSPLNQEVREKKQLAFGIDAGSYALANGGVFAIQAVCAPDKRVAVEQEALAILKRVRNDGVTAAQLDKARHSLLANQLRSLTTASGRAGDLGSNWFYTRNLNFSSDYFNAVSRVTSADIQRVANRYLVEDHLNASSLNPVGSLTKAAGADKVEARVPEVKKFVLPNGLRLLVREDHRFPLVTMLAIFKGSLLAETPETNGATRLMSKSLLKGTTKHSAEQIANTIEAVGGSIGSDSVNNSFFVTAGVMKPDLKLGLDLVAEVLEHPTFPENEVNIERATQLADIQAEEDEPRNVGMKAMRKKLFGDHPYALSPSGAPEVVAKLTVAQLREMHDRLAVAKNGVLAVFGDVNADEVLKLATEAFGNLPAGKGEIQNPPAAAKLTEPQILTLDRPKNQAVVTIGYPGVDILSADRPALELIDTASSDQGTRFWDIIREKMGLAYYVGTNQFVGPTPGMFIFFLGTDPAKVDDVRKVFREEIGVLAKNGLSEEELARAKKKILGAEAVRNQSNSAMAQSVALDELFGLGAEHYQQRKAEIEAVTTEDTKRVAAKYFTEPGNVEVIVAPPKK